MKKSEIKAMNRSFGILEERKSKILDNDRTLKLRERVKEIREHSINNMEDLIDKGTRRLQDNGVEVIFAEKSVDALEAVYSIVQDQSIVAKSKSNTAGEIGLTEFLQDRGVDVIETDLGDRIVQLDPDSKPSHPIGPASHLRIEDIAEIISKELNTEVKPEARAILNIIKEDVLLKLSNCNVGITGANSVAADDGSILTVHNEGNINLVSMLDIHIVIVGIDKFVETIEDAVSVVKLETVYATGKTVPSYMNVISSPSHRTDPP
jgi:L-lactate dehydrogenase complex protein LldG